MDQMKIGKFIQECRKEKGYTQMSLAEKLGITDRAVSKWETGRSLPDSSVMLDLCDLLSININELLRGERIDMENIAKASETLVVEMKKNEEEQSRKMLRMETFLGLTGIISAVIIILTASYLFEREPVSAIILMVTGFAMMMAVAYIGLWIEQTAGFYQCAECGHCHKPTFKQVFLAKHIGRTRKLVCPACGKKSYQKKVLSNQE